ncbi:MAG TPA: flagellar FlbD family protein [Phycisphaerae bacterium]|nr:flagellar FlbD family protein [Phycisphaerae bacterium]HOJ74299.1 flagellar FlbD family protein [Phycisphaerae bacterium]HOM51378.1 flagellar FlbD family protein [Phycisphaerae bacterium]HON66916.1 flagellar FlbD family protein [Phycisphaerae bacterium]HOQ84991.1 flagellar FlbD family protein [Phycisphaerae bacterium]
MIRLTRLNNTSFILNADLIKTIEERPDTTITLINGETFIVRDTVEEVVARAVEYGRAVRAFRP